MIYANLNKVKKANKNNFNEEIEHIVQVQLQLV